MQEKHGLELPPSSRGKLVSGGSVFSVFLETHSIQCTTVKNSKMFLQICFLISLEYVTILEHFLSGKLQGEDTECENHTVLTPDHRAVSVLSVTVLPSVSHVLSPCRSRWDQRASQEVRAPHLCRCTSFHCMSERPQFSQTEDL